MLMDLHNHTMFSYDSTDTVEVVIENAIKHGVDVVGITDHQFTIGADLPKYYQYIQKCKIKYTNDIKVLCGLEIGTRPKPDDLLADAVRDFDYVLFESVAFALVGILVWLYMLIVKKYKYNPFKKTEITRLSAATCETLGTVAYTFAAAISPILTSPITASYCLVTIILARIFLKERLTKKQYLSLALLVAGIALLGASEIFNA